MKKIKFSECVEYMIKGPFGSDMKKSLYVPKGDDTYKVYIQGNAIQKDQALGDYYVSEEYFHKKLERFEVHPGDYIITCDGTLGKFLKLDEKIERGVISSSLLLLKLKEDVIYDKYFELIWEYSMLKYLASQARNACLVHLPSAKAIGDVEILLPDLEEQIKLADRAFAVGNVVEKRAEELEMLDELIKARFVELFGDVATEDYKYETKKLGDVAEVGSSHRVFTSEFVENGIPFYRGTEIGELANGQKPSDPYYISEEHYNRLANDETKPKVGDLLMPSICNKGQVWMVDTEEPFYYKDGRVLCISPDREIYNPKYLQYFMRVKTEVEYPKMGSGSTFAEFKIFLLKNFDILTPPRIIQDDFTAFVEQVDKSKVVVQKALDETQTLFDSLMQEYFG